MTIKAELLRTTAALAGAKVPHALIGGLAVGFSGVARFTNDIDLLIDASARDPALKALAALGYTIWQDGPEFLQMKGAIPLDLMWARRPLSQAMIVRATPLPGLGIPCVSVEDLIGLKIQSFATNRRREHKDKADIQALASVRSVDAAKIKEYADLFGVWGEVQPLLRRGTP